MTSPLNLELFAVRSAMPIEDVRELERCEPGFVQAALNDTYDWICARLAKRYATPFGAPAPGIVVRWNVLLTTPLCYGKRGTNTELYEKFEGQALEAKAEVREAADAKDGLFDLPLRADSEVTGIVKGAPLAYHERSPYEWMGRQSERWRRGQR